MLANGFINDIISFNGCIYVAISNSQAVQSDSGFMIYKATQVGAGQPGANEAGLEMGGYRSGRTRQL